MEIINKLLLNVYNSDIHGGTIEIPNSVTRIGDWAFDNCYSLTNITIPDNITSIGEKAFYNCSSLTSVTIPNSITSIGNYAFRGCISLKSKKDNYKAFLIDEKGLFAKQRAKRYSIGKRCYVKGDIKICENGLHYCTNIFDIFTYYAGEYGKDFVIAVCDVSDDNIGHVDNSKRCAKWVIPRKILTREEVISIMNGKDI